MIGAHVTGLLRGVPLAGSAPPSEAEQKFNQAMAAWDAQELAYARMHGTKPQTLAVGLNDSPAGLASWIVEKFRTWGDTKGDIESRFSKDELLTNLTIYWATGTIASSSAALLRVQAREAAAGQGHGPHCAPHRHTRHGPAPARSLRAHVQRRAAGLKRTRAAISSNGKSPQLVAQDMRAFFGSLQAR